MSRDALRVQSGLFGFGIVIASSTLVWQGITHARQFLRASHEVSKLRASLTVSQELSQRIVADMVEQMTRGLLGDTQRSTLLMLPSWLPRLPSGEESGVAFAIDFGGTSFRVMQVCLGRGTNEVKLISSSEVDIPSAIYTGSIESLYDFIASEVAAYAAARGFSLHEPASTRASDPCALESSQPSANLEGSILEEAASTVTHVAAAAGGSDRTGQGDARPSTHAGATGNELHNPSDSELRNSNTVMGDTPAGSRPAAVDGAQGEAAVSVGAVDVSETEAASVAAVASDAMGNARVSTGSGLGSMASDATELPPIGFCFSFPMKQTALTSGSLLRWTKGFQLEDGLGSDPVESLHAALHRQGWRGDIAALLNDGVGVFGAGRYLDSSTAISFILGTGTNAAYMERIANMPVMLAQENSAGVASTVGEGHTVVNTEWGAFDSPLLPRCAADIHLDGESVRPGSQSFEKLVSGLYLGEIVRMSFLDIAEATGLLQATAWGRLPVSDTLSAPQVQAIDEDDSVSQQRTAAVLMHAFGMRRQQCSLLVCWAIKQTAAAVVQRAADLIAAGLTALLTKVGAPSKGGVYGIAADGSVYHKYPKFRARLHVSLARCLLPLGGALENPEAVPANLDVGLGGPPEAKFRVRFVDAQSGSCFGAAVIAATAVGGVLPNLPERMEALEEEGSTGSALADFVRGVRRRHGGGPCGDGLNTAVDATIDSWFPSA